MNLLRYAGIAVVALCLQPGPARADDIAGAGSTFVASVLSTWSAGHRATGGSGLDDQPIGSGGGIASLKSGLVDFAASDAPLRPADLQRFGLLQFPLVVGGVVPILNIDGVRSGELRLTGALLAVAARTKAAVAFFRWSLQHGQDQATALGFVPLPPDVVSRIEAYWHTRFADGQ